MQNRKMQWVLGLGLLASLPGPLWAKAPAEKAAPAPAAKESPAQPAEGADRPLVASVMIRVNERDFTVQEYATFLQSHPAIISRATSSNEGKAAALKEMASAYLLSEQLYREGLLKREGDKKPSQQEAIKAYEKLAETNFPLPPIPDEKAAHQYYVDHPDKYGIPASVRLNQLLFKVPENAPEAVKSAARERAEKALKRLAGGEKLPQLASEISENPIGKVANGDVGYRYRDDEPWLKEALQGKKVGDRTGIVTSPEGFEILEITDSREALLSPYANVRDQVIKEMRDAEQQKLRDAYVATLAKKAKVEVVMPDLKPLFPNGIFQ